MERPDRRQNLIFWELIIAFMFTVSATILHTFHFYNNAWLVHINGSYTYKRGLGDDCISSPQFSTPVLCRKWSDSTSIYVTHGHIAPSDVVPPSIYLSTARFLMFVSILLYVTAIISISIACVRRTFKLQIFMCSTTLLLGLCFLKVSFLVLSSTTVIFLVVKCSSEPFIKSMKSCSLGSAFYYFLLSNLLLYIGSVAHFDSWVNVYVHLRNHFSRPNNRQLNLPERTPSSLAMLNVI